MMAAAGDGKFCKERDDRLLERCVTKNYLVFNLVWRQCASAVRWRQYAD